MLPVRGKMLSEADILTDAAAELKRRLPEGWYVVFSSADRSADAVLRLTEPGGRSCRAVVEVETDPTPRSIRGVLAEAQSARVADRPLIVAPYLSPRARKLIVEAGANYLDLTGNMRVALTDPPLFLQDRGADANPFPTRTSKRTLAGAAAGRVVLTLTELVPPFSKWTLTHVAGESKASLPYVSRIVELLEREDLVRRVPRGSITDVDRPGLVRRWAEDYSLLGSNRGGLYLNPRGPAPPLEALGTIEVQRELGKYALSGSFAANRFKLPESDESVEFARVTTPTKVVCFVEYPDTAAKILGLSPATGAGNVFLLAPYDPVVFDRVVAGNGDLRWATAGQVIVDCLTGPDRMPEEGEALLAYMRRKSPLWRGFRADGGSS